MAHIKEILRILFYSFVSFVSGFRKINANKIIITSTQNISYNFNSKYFFEYLSNNSEWKEFDVYYVINDGAKRRMLNAQYNTDKFIETDSLKGALFSLDAKFWVSSTFELPVNSLYRDRRRVVLHLGHGVPLKKIGLNEENIPLLKKINRIIRTRQFTDIVCYSERLKDNMHRTFSNESANYLFFGQPRNDILGLDLSQSRIKLKNIAQATGDAKFILYAPTWRPYASTIFFPFALNAEKLDVFLKENNIYIFTRSHPFYSSEISEEVANLSNVIEFNSDIAPEICDFLTCFDGLITDYSSIYIDYLVADRKIAFIPYDYEMYKDKVGFCHSYNDFTPGLKIGNEEDLKQFLLSDDKEFQDVRVGIRELTNTKSSGNCFEISKYIKSHC